MTCALPAISGAPPVSRALLLTWMESHPWPFACTTNFAEALDPASLRRFVFKVKLDYLNAEQAEQAFRVFFDLEPPSGLAAMRILTPGDFAVVRRKAKIHGRLEDADALVAMPQKECDDKPAQSGKVGFRGRGFSGVTMSGVMREKENEHDKESLSFHT